MPPNQDAWPPDLTLCGVGYGYSYLKLCLKGSIPIRIGGGGTISTTPHHRLHGDICISLPLLDGCGSIYSKGNVTLRSTVPLSLCLGGEGEVDHKCIGTPMVGNILPDRLSMGVCSDITTLTPIRVYKGDLSVLLPTIGNHLPELEGYQNACPTQCPRGMPGDTTRYYPHEMGQEPPPSIWQDVPGVELRILQETPYTSPYGYHQVWLLADLWFRDKQVMYLRNGDKAQAPSRYILDRGAFNSLIVYLTEALGMPHRIYQEASPRQQYLDKDIKLVKQWGMGYTHIR